MERLLFMLNGFISRVCCIPYPEMLVLGARVVAGVNFRVPRGMANQPEDATVICYKPIYNTEYKSLRTLLEQTNRQLVTYQRREEYTPIVPETRTYPHFVDEQAFKKSCPCANEDNKCNGGHMFLQTPLCQNF